MAWPPFFQAPWWRFTGENAANPPEVQSGEETGKTRHITGITSALFFTLMGLASLPALLQGNWLVGEVTSLYPLAAFVFISGSPRQGVQLRWLGGVILTC